MRICFWKGSAWWTTSGTEHGQAPEPPLRGAVPVPGGVPGGLEVAQSPGLGTGGHQAQPGLPGLGGLVQPQ